MNKELILRGDSLKFINGFEIKQPTVDDVLDIGYGTYMWFINCWCQKPQDIVVELWGKGIDFEKITRDELFLKSIGENKDVFTTILKKFSNIEHVWFEYIDEFEQEFICAKLGSEHKNISFVIGFDAFEYISKFFKKIHHYEHAKLRRFAGEKTKKMILDEDYDELVHNSKINKEKNEDIFGNLLSTLIVMHHRTWDYVFSLTMGRFIEELNKGSVKEQVDLTLRGIYNGNIDGKKIPSKNLNWKNI